MPVFLYSYYRRGRCFEGCPPGTHCSFGLCQCNNGRLKFFSSTLQVYVFTLILSYNLDFISLKTVGQNLKFVREISVHCYYVHVCFIKVTKSWRSRRAWVRAFFYSYHVFLDHRTNISRKVRAPRCVSTSRAPDHVQNCHMDKTNL